MLWMPYSVGFVPITTLMAPCRNRSYVLLTNLWRTSTNKPLPTEYYYSNTQSIHFIVSMGKYLCDGVLPSFCTHALLTEHFFLVTHTHKDGTFLSCYTHTHGAFLSCYTHTHTHIRWGISLWLHTHITLTKYIVQLHDNTEYWVSGLTETEYSNIAVNCLWVTTIGWSWMVTIHYIHVWR